MEEQEIKLSAKEVVELCDIHYVRGLVGNAIRQNKGEVAVALLNAAKEKLKSEMDIDLGEILNAAAATGMGITYDKEEMRKTVLYVLERYPVKLSEYDEKDYLFMDGLKVWGEEIEKCVNNGLDKISLSKSVKKEYRKWLGKRSCSFVVGVGLIDRLTDAHIEGLKEVHFWNSVAILNDWEENGLEERFDEVKSGLVAWKEKLSPWMLKNFQTYESSEKWKGFMTAKRMFEKLSLMSNVEVNGKEKLRKAL
jgi:hypothetical protein